MTVLGLTGSIAAGKTTAATMFGRLGASVFDADAEVRALYAPGGAAVPALERAFPGVGAKGYVEDGELWRHARSSPSGLAEVEAIVHGLVIRRLEAFLDEARGREERLVVLEIPLLFETGCERYCDLVVVVVVSPDTQRRRALARPRMTEEKLAALLRRQMPDHERVARADFVVSTDRPLGETEERVREIIRLVRSGTAEASRQGELITVSRAEKAPTARAFLDLLRARLREGARRGIGRARSPRKGTSQRRREARRSSMPFTI